MCVQELGAKWLWSHCIVQGAAARLEGEVAMLVRTIKFWAAHVPEKTVEVIELFMSDH